MNQFGSGFGMRLGVLCNIPAFVRGQYFPILRNRTDNITTAAGAKGRFLGFFSGTYIRIRFPWLQSNDILVLISAAFAFIGTEITAIAAAETANVCYKSTRQADTAILGSERKT